MIHVRVTDARHDINEIDNYIQYFEGHEGAGHMSESRTPDTTLLMK